MFLFYIIKNELLKKRLISLYCKGIVEYSLTLYKTVTGKQVILFYLFAFTERADHLSSIKTVGKFVFAPKNLFVGTFESD